MHNHAGSDGIVMLSSLILSARLHTTISTHLDDFTPLEDNGKGKFK